MQLIGPGSCVAQLANVRGPWTLEGVRHSHDPLISLEVNESPGSVNTQTLFEAKPSKTIALAMHKQSSHLKLSLPVVKHRAKVNGPHEYATAHHPLYIMCGILCIMGSTLPAAELRKKALECARK